jgi:hypothetical protein
LVLTLEPSRARWVWWLALHALLASAALLAALPWWSTLIALAAIVTHAVGRRPRGTPDTILVGADGYCVVPEWDEGRWALGPQTSVCPYWIRLEIGVGVGRRDIVLFADQLDGEQWARLRGLLERVRCDAAHVPRPSRGTNLS